jgi:hypothetical protein
MTIFSSCAIFMLSLFCKLFTLHLKQYKGATTQMLQGCKDKPAFLKNLNKNIMLIFQVKNTANRFYWP